MQWNHSTVTLRISFRVWRSGIENVWFLWAVNYHFFRIGATVCRTGVVKCFSCLHVRWKSLPLPLWHTGRDSCSFPPPGKKYQGRGKGSEMRQRLAWNNGKPHRQSYRPVSVSWHTLLAKGTPLFHVRRCSISFPFLCAGINMRWNFLIANKFEQKDINVKMDV